MTKTSLITLALVALAAAAHADPLALRPPAPDAAKAIPVALVLPKPGVVWQAVQQKTAVEHRADNGVTLAAGYLCGIDKFADRASERIAGPTSSYGRQGTFLGASLGVAF